MLMISNLPTLSLSVQNISSSKLNRGGGGGSLVGFLGLSRYVLGGFTIRSP